MARIGLPAKTRSICPYCRTVLDAELLERNVLRLNQNVAPEAISR